MATEIQLSKTKLTATLMGSIAFIAIGFWFLINPPLNNYWLFRNPLAVRIVGMLSILFFGLVAFTVFKKLNDRSPGLIISDEGITDNASGVSAGFIPWTDVVEIRETIVVNQKFVNVIVTNPQYYIDKQKSTFKRKMAQLNYNTYNTAIAIPAVALKCDFNELKTILEKGFSDFKQGKTT